MYCEVLRIDFDIEMFCTESHEQGKSDVKTQRGSRYAVGLCES